MKKLSEEKLIAAIVVTWQLVNLVRKLTGAGYTSWLHVFIPFIFFFSTVGFLYTISIFLTKEPAQHERI